MLDKVNSIIILNTAKEKIKMILGIDITNYGCGCKREGWRRIGETKIYNNFFTNNTKLVLNMQSKVNRYI